MAIPNLPPEMLRQAATTAGVQTADGRALMLMEGDPAGRALADVLKPGEVITGRVIEQLANGSYLFTLRGRNLIADSKLPLAPDSTAKFQVLQQHGQLGLRLLDQGQTDQARTSGAGQRLQAMGLPQTAIAAVVLTAFEDAGAPLTPRGLTGAHAAVAKLTPEQALPVARAHALLARAGLPPTPALVQVAHQAQAGGLPQPGPAALQLLNTLPTNSAPTPGQAVIAPAGTAPPLAATAPAVAPPAGPTPATPPASTVGPPTTAGLASPTAPLTSSGPPARLPATASISPAEVHQVLQPPLPAEASAQSRALDANGIRPIAATAEAQATAAVVAAALPTPESEAPRTLIQDLLTMARTMAPPAGGEALGDAATILAREQLAEALLPPAHLRDYDQVLPLALPGSPHPPPARLAISRRRTGNGDEAVFLRVDVELSNIGPLSLRLTAMTGGPLAIVLMTAGRGVDALEAERDSLMADLAGQDIEVTLRIADLASEGATGA